MGDSKLFRRMTNRLYPGFGCSDSSCVFGYAGGMATNGGCECLRETNLALMRRNLLVLSNVAKSLAELVPVDAIDGEKHG